MLSHRVVQKNKLDKKFVDEIKNEDKYVTNIIPLLLHSSLIKYLYELIKDTPITLN